MRALIAGVGNALFGDDGFGVAVVEHLRRQRLPEQTEVLDYGIRALHLAYDLLAPHSLLVVVDVVSRGGPPGTLYVIDPVVDSIDRRRLVPDAHGMDLTTVFSALRNLGAEPPPTRLVGCEPDSLNEGMRLSRAVRAAVEPAARIVQRLVERGAASS